MKAQVLRRILPTEAEPLELVDLPIPDIGFKEILVKVTACGICHTELDEIEGRVSPKLPVVPGHQVVGRVFKVGAGACRFEVGQRVGIAWIYWTCGKCYYCRRGLENLCDNFMATGCDVNGGYAEYLVVHEDFAYPIPDRFSDSEAAPLLCAGAIGYRALKLTEMQDGEVLGLYGYGASGHIVHQIARHLYPNSEIYVFTRKRGDEPSRLAEKLGAQWVGATGDTPPKKLSRAIDTTPSVFPVKEALRNIAKGGRLVINVIRKEEPTLELNYMEHLWLEKEVKTVANITRRDVEEFLPLAAKIPIIPEVVEFNLEEANKALKALKHGKYKGAGVLKIA
jgi:propanol-preferring alcohol dehydrogenase